MVMVGVHRWFDVDRKHCYVGHMDVARGSRGLSVHWCERGERLTREGAFCCV